MNTDQVLCMWCVVCVCVVIPFILEVRFVNVPCTMHHAPCSRGGSHRRRGHARFLFHLLSAVLALIFIARRIQPLLSNNNMLLFSARLHQRGGVSLSGCCVAYKVRRAADARLEDGDVEQQRLVFPPGEAAEEFTRLRCHRGLSPP